MKYIITVVIGVLLTVASYSSYQAYQWKHYADERSYLSERCGIYLFGPAGVIGPDDHELSRQQLFDAYLHQVIEKSPDFRFK